MNSTPGNMSLRFIDSGAMNAAANMALDEALALQLARHRQGGYLRFYRWQPAALSFGYNQRIEKLIDTATVASSGLGIVRRMSGGKMVFHADEHTFSLGLTAEFIRATTGNNATFLEMFKFAIEPMVTALVAQGVPARFSSAREISAGNSNHLHCYAAAAGHSIFAGNHKLIGAAGVFRDECLIIHGSMPITNIRPPAELFNADFREAGNVEMSSLSDFLTPEKVTGLPMAVARVYAACFNCTLACEQPDAAENSLAERLTIEKYSHLDWNINRNATKSVA
ncbi:MAG TPA: hypothetical protein PLM07_03705 [Candidatus Rifleibacterium sp.]|nr:hypothetical protein [Candidatus Rifleibacterium sp.]HPT44990.1 hypothetical protein [Candidatus Rifleibacterium sp.]